MSNNSKYKVGDQYRMQPAVIDTATDEEVESLFSILEVRPKTLILKHRSSGYEVEFFAERRIGFDEPDIFRHRGCFKLSASGLTHEPGWHPKQLAAELKKRGESDMRAMLSELGFQISRKPLDGIDAEIEAIVAAGRSSDSVAKLRGKLMIVSDAQAVQISLILLNWHDTPSSSPDEAIDICNYAMGLAEKQGLREPLAVLKSYRAVHRAHLMLNASLESWGFRQAELRTGFSEARRCAALDARAKELSREVQEDLYFAYEVCRTAKDTGLVGLLVNLRISVAGMIGNQHKRLGMPYEDSLKDLFDTFQVTKDFLEKNKDFHTLAYLHHNMANQLRDLGKRPEALGLAEEAKRVFTELGHTDALVKSNMLIDRIKSES